MEKTKLVANCDQLSSLKHSSINLLDKKFTDAEIVTHNA
jgi:hypothetical protein